MEFENEIVLKNKKNCSNKTNKNKTNSPMMMGYINGTQAN